MSGSQDTSAASSLALAKSALEKINAFRLSAMPSNYEIWYNYCGGSNPAINRDIDTIVSAKGSINQVELERVCLSHLHSMRAEEKVRRVETDFDGRLREFARLLDDALRDTVEYDDALSGAARLLSSDDIEAITEALGSIVQLTKDRLSAGDELRKRLDLSKHEVATLKNVIEALRVETQIDALTGLFNRKSFESALTDAMRDAGGLLSLLLLDIDHFKVFNDRFGHNTGDQVLKLVAHVAKQNTKGRDLVARIGGEEFAIILPDTTLQHALSVGNQIRRAVMATELKKKSTGERLGKITISAGATAICMTDTLESLIERADRYLYDAKRSGRNQVCGGIEIGGIGD